MNRRQAATTALSLLLLISLFWFVDRQQLAETLQRTDLRWYVIGLVVFLSTYVPLSLRWQTLQTEVGYELTIQDSFEIISVSNGLNKLLPANSGDLARSKITEEYTPVDSHAELLGLVAFERVVDVLTLGTLIVASSLLISIDAVSTVRNMAIGTTILLIALLSLATLRPIREALLSSVPGSVQLSVNRVLFGYQRVSVPTLTRVGSYSLLRWLLGSITFLPLALALGQTVSVPLAIFATGVMSVAATLPLSPGGIGPVDTAGTGVFVLFGMSYSEALSLVILQRSLGLVLTAIVGIVVYNYRSINPKTEAN